MNEMDESAISMRYARAFFTLGKEKNLLSVIKNDMELLSAAIIQSNEFNLMLKSPVIKTSEKIRLLRHLFEEAVNPFTINLLELVLHHKRELFLSSICRNVLAFIRQEKNIKSAVLTTAVEIDSQTLKLAEKCLEKELGTTVELRGKVNRQLIGGLILSIDDKQYDASIATQLKKIRKKLIKTSS